MRTLTIIITAEDADDTSWGQVADAIANSLPVSRDLPFGSEWSGDFSRMAYGVRVAMAVQDGDPEAGTLDTLEALIEALDEVREVYTRLELQKGVLADALKANDEEQAEFSRGRIGRHTVNLSKAQERLEAAQRAHANSKR